MSSASTLLMSGSPDVGVRGSIARAVRSSRLVRTMTPICEGSVLYRLVARLTLSLSGRSSWIGRWLADRPLSRDFSEATFVAVDSTLLGAIERFFIAVARAWNASVLKRMIVDRGGAALEPWQRVRLAGLVVMTAAVARAIIGIGGAAPGWPGWAAWTLVFGSGVVLFLACRALAAAWIGWRNRLSHRA